MSKRLSSALLLLCALVLACACSKGPDAAQSPEETRREAEASLLAKLKIDENTPKVLFTYLDDKGEYVTVEKSADVPDPYRNDVVVVNLALSPEARKAQTKVAVADLNRKNTDGSFVLRLEDRATFENELKLKRQWGLSALAKAPKAVDPAKLPKLSPNKDKVVLYDTSWCGYCKKLKTWLTEHQIPFTERDVEKDDGAQEELLARCQAANTACNGVPVLDFKGVIIPGYNPAMIEKLLSSPQAAAAPSHP